MYIPQKGNIIKMHTWHGVVMDVFTSSTGGIVLKVQTVRNVFRKLPPELIELEVAPGSIAPATYADLRAEIDRHYQMQESAIEALLSEVASPLADEKRKLEPAVPAI